MKRIITGLLIGLIAGIISHFYVPLAIGFASGAGYVVGRNDD